MASSNGNLQAVSVLGVGSLGAGQLSSESEIRVTPLSVDAAVSRIRELRTEAEAVQVKSTGKGWSGPGNRAMAELSASVSTMRLALIAMLENSARAIGGAKDDFVATDSSLAAGMQALGEDDLLQ